MGFLVIFLVTAVFCCVPTWCYEPREKIFVLQDPNYQDNRTVVVVTWTDEDGSTCEIFSDDKLTEAILRISKDKLLRRPTRTQMQELLEECTTFSRRRRSVEDNDVTRIEDNDGEYEKTTPLPSPQNGPADGWVIFPGTKWCGAGDKAKTDDDLGFHQDTDRCCRAHDKCDDLIEGGGTKHNLTNKSPFTKLNCKCDDEFYDCLKRVNSVTSNTIGNTYFNVLKRPCYYYDYPLTKKCKKYRTFLKLKCVEYEKNTKVPKIWQWRSAKRYKKLPFPGPLDITLPF
ncbi:Phospholipase A2 [Araneus ventricosus]|uniref:Phospholipase A2 n=1 Tax=Araneus ventricosus TaxID=182803 RepID=A0A4Y2JL64_ARAVE|nr:Phospholipase A2 [Araneus ventricosus]